MLDITSAIMNVATSEVVFLALFSNFHSLIGSWWMVAVEDMGADSKFVVRGR